MCQHSVHAVVVVFALCVAVARGVAVEEFRVVYEWYKLDFTWQDDQAKFDAYTRKLYEPKNNVIQSIKIWGDLAFLTLPRSKTGVPATLVTVPSVPMSNSASPRLQPFPTWPFQEMGNCASLQNVHAIEIDPDGFLWVADSGTVGELDEYSKPSSKCPPKLVIFDVKRRELLSDYEFSRELLGPMPVLTDIVIDPRGNKTAYISVINGDGVSSLVVFHNQTKSAVRIDGLPRVKPTSVAVNGTEVHLKLNKVSLALDVWHNTLYLSPSWEEVLYSVDTWTLKNAAPLKPVGHLPGLCYGLVLDSKQVLYYTVLEKDSVGKWNTTKLKDGQKIIAVDHSFLQFPSAFAFDRSENLWVLSNRLQTYLNNDVNLEVPNFRLLRAYTGSNSYLHAPQPASASFVIVSRLLLVLSLVLVIRR